VAAKDKENPEMEDSSGDCPLGFIDIISAWFYEDPEDAKYLYAAIQVRHLEYKMILTGYTIFWEYDGTLYNLLGITWGRGSNVIFFAGILGGNLHNVAGSFDLEHDIIAMKIPKKVIGDPEPGDALNRPYAHTIFTPIANLLEPFHLYWLSDYAPDNLRGKNYIIQY
jgi:hypothetical protein